VCTIDQVLPALPAATSAFTSVSHAGIQPNVAKLARLGLARVDTDPIGQRA